MKGEEKVAMGISYDVSIPVYHSVQVLCVKKAENRNGQRRSTVTEY